MSSKFRTNKLLPYYRGNKLKKIAIGKEIVWVGAEPYTVTLSASDFTVTQTHASVTGILTSGSYIGFGIIKGGSDTGNGSGYIKSKSYETKGCSKCVIYYQLYAGGNNWDVGTLQVAGKSVSGSIKNGTLKGSVTIDVSNLDKFAVQASFTSPHSYGYTYFYFEKIQFIE